MTQEAYCTKCNGTDIKFDAWAVWSVDEQDWVLHSVYDHVFCETCEKECTYKLRDIK